MILDVLVHLDDLAADGRVEVAHGLDGLDLAEGPAGIYDTTELRQIAVDEVSFVPAAELVDGEVGAANGRGIFFDLDPLVSGEVVAIVGAPVQFLGV